METLCNAVKENECWDFDNEECIDIANVVDWWLHRFVGYIHEDYPALRISRLVRGGSMKEKTRLLRNSPGREEVEFDYLVVIERWPDIESLRFEHSHPGYMKIQYSRTNALPGIDKKFYHSTDTSQHILQILETCLNRRCKGNLCDRISGSKRKIKLKKCSVCKVYSKTGCMQFDFNHRWSWPTEKLCFVWTPYVPMTTNDQSSFGPDFFDVISKECTLLRNPLSKKKINVRVDFHPVFELDLSHIVQDESSQPPSSIPKGYRQPSYLFPRNCRGQCGKENFTYCWRISTIKLELALIKSTTSEHRYAYMTLKFLLINLVKCLYHLMNESAEMNKFYKITPYMVKTIFFYHIKDCSRCNIKDCIADMFKYMLNAFKDRKLEHFYLEYNIFEEDAVRETLQTTRFLEYLTKLLRKSDVSNMSDIAKDCFSLCFILRGKNLLLNENFITEGNFSFKKIIERRSTLSAEDTLKITCYEYKENVSNYRPLTRFWMNTNVPLFKRIEEFLEQDVQNRRQIQPLEDTERKNENGKVPEEETETKAENGKTTEEETKSEIMTRSKTKRLKMTV